MERVVDPSVPAKSLRKSRECVAREAGKVDYGSPGVGSPHHVGMELLKDRAILDMTHMPYKGAAPAIQDLLGGQIPVMPGLPAPVLARRNQTFNAASKTPAVVSKSEDFGMEFMPSDAARFQEFAADESKRWGELIRKRSITLEKARAALRCARDRVVRAS